ncbi:hypothetical protein CI102_2945 [Trichoderma harzianum]|nr:hypothetical protein CI102_2945 [Trichoderma harzianum]
MCQVCGNYNSTAHIALTEPFARYPLKDFDVYMRERYETSFADDNSPNHATSPEFCAMHLGCYQIVQQVGHVADEESLNRLWILTAWKNPWRGMERLRLSNDIIDDEVLEKTARFGGIPLLCSLPREIIHMIKRYSEDSVFWRCMMAIRLAAWISRTSPQPVRAMPLRSVFSWERNGELRRIEPLSPPLPVIKLTIDCEGIRKMERLPTRPQYSGRWSRPAKHLAYIVEDEASLEGVKVQLKDGRFRLKLPRQLRNVRLHVWNSPTPPNLSLCMVYPKKIMPIQRFNVVELSEIRGITFYLNTTVVLAMHIHLTEQESTLWTDKAVLEEKRPDAIFSEPIRVYLPLPKGDRITYLGANGSDDRLNVIFVRMEKAGDITIGQRQPGTGEDKVLAAQSSVSLVYCEPNKREMLPFFGAYQASPATLDVASRPIFAEIGANRMGRFTYYSWASLDGVSSVRIFYEDDFEFCRGLMFYYENGASRTVGDCRVQIDREATVDKPTQICFRTKVPESENGENGIGTVCKLRVEFEHHNGHDERWHCLPFRGIIRFWIAGGFSWLSVEQ